MWLNSLYLDVDRQLVRIGDRVFAGARRDIDVLPSETTHRRMPRRRIGSEVEPDRRLHVFWFSTRLHVQLQHEIGARFEGPRETFRQKRRHLTGRPSEKVPVRK